MSTCLIDLREPNADHVSIHDLSQMLKKGLGKKLPKLLSVTNPNDDLYLQFSKCLWRFQDHCNSSDDPLYSPQNRELLELEKALQKTVAKFEKLSPETKDDLDFEVLTRDPFNAKFYFPEQKSYWENNKDTCKIAKQKIELVGFAIRELKKTRAIHGRPSPKSSNEDLTWLIQNLDHCANEFAGLGYKGTCYDVDATSSAEGDFLELVVTLLDAFAPKSYHSRRALGQTIKRARDRMKPRKDS